MILSASRRTDLPNYYAEWFFNRIREGFLYVRNPMNAHQISRVDLSPAVVDCIVFWSKNPTPLLRRLDSLRDYMYYIQFTLEGYGRDIEPHLPDKKAVLIQAFQELSRQLGPRRMVWRYDPILFNPRYTPDYHLRAFEEIAGQLEGFADRAVISFVDLYAKTRRGTAGLDIREPEKAELLDFAGQLAETARRHGFTLESCAEAIDLAPAGVRHGSCIDKALIEELLGCRLKVSRDKTQRPECGCFESIDAGAYNTCRNGCKYCYANFSPQQVERNAGLYDPESPILCGTLGPEDVVTERRVTSLKETQISLF